MLCPEAELRCRRTARLPGNPANRFMAKNSNRAFWEHVLYWYTSRNPPGRLCVLLEVPAAHWKDAWAKIALVLQTCTAEQGQGLFLLEATTGPVPPPCGCPSASLLQPWHVARRMPQLLPCHQPRFLMPAPRADVLHQESAASGCAHTQHRAGGDRQAGRAVQTGCASLAAVLPAFSTHKPSLSRRNLGWRKKDSGGMRLQAGARTKSLLDPQRDPTAGRTMAPGQDADSQACRRSEGCWGSPPVGRHCGGPVVKGWPWTERKM